MAVTFKLYNKLPFIRKLISVPESTKKQSVMGMQWLKAIPCFRIFYQEIKVPVRMLCKVLTLGVALGNFLFRGSFSFHEFRVYHCILKSV